MIEKFEDYFGRGLRATVGKCGVVLRTLSGASKERSPVRVSLKNSSLLVRVLNVEFKIFKRVDW